MMAIALTAILAGSISGLPASPAPDFSEIDSYDRVVISLARTHLLGECFPVTERYEIRIWCPSGTYLSVEIYRETYENDEGVKSECKRQTGEFIVPSNEKPRLDRFLMRSRSAPRLLRGSLEEPVRVDRFRIHWERDGGIAYQELHALQVEATGEEMTLTELLERGTSLEHGTSEPSQPGS